MFWQKHKTLLLIPAVFLAVFILSGCTDNQINSSFVEPKAKATDAAKQIPIKEITQSTSKKGQDDYVCNCNKTCSQLSCAEAQYQLNSCGCSVRDRDGDGVACDSQCQ